MYWYELIHRPVSNVTVPEGFTEMESNHINRNGFAFGKVAYKSPVTSKERFHFDLEPLHKEGMWELSLVTQDSLNGLSIKTTVDVVNHLVDNNMINMIKNEKWTYINIEELKQITLDKKAELKEIYVMLKNNR